jgi:hypothetical protein
MTERLDDRIRVACILLTALKAGPLRWGELTKATLQKSPTPWKVRAAMNWLLNQGCIDRHGGEYSITLKGEALLRLWSSGSSPPP